ncbi:hypothetical protein PT2222_40078 [Paraburkholderia tropica]
MAKVQQVFPAFLEIQLWIAFGILRCAVASRYPNSLQIVCEHRANGSRTVCVSVPQWTRIHACDS